MKGLFFWCWHQPWEPNSVGLSNNQKACRGRGASCCSSPTAIGPGVRRNHSFVDGLLTWLRRKPCRSRAPGWDSSRSRRSSMCVVHEVDLRFRIHAPILVVSQWRQATGCARHSRAPPDSSRASQRVLSDKMSRNLGNSL